MYQGCNILSVHVKTQSDIMILILLKRVTLENILLEECMNTLLYLLITFLYVILVIMSYRTFRESSYWGTTWVLFINLAMIFESGVYLLGTLTEAGVALEILSQVRYVLHVLLTPTLVLISLDILRRIQVDWSEYLVTKTVFHMFAVFLTMLGILTGILWSDLVSIEVHGMVRYVPYSDYFPYATILSIIPLTFAGYMMWRKLRSPFFLIGILLSYIGGGIAYLYEQFWLEGLFEVLFVWSLVIVEQILRTEDFQTEKILPIKRK